MLSYKEIEGDLIELTKEGRFDVISHGVNCFCTMRSGIAPLMSEAFGCNKFNMERPKYRGDINKLGTIDYGEYYRSKGNNTYIVNSYTQFGFGINHEEGTQIPLDYNALRLCMKKINHIFAGKTIGLPYVIGCGLAGGDIPTVLNIIKEELNNMNIVMVKLPIKKQFKRK